MILGKILADRDLLGKLDDLAHDQEVTQEILLYLLETDNADPHDWTEETLIQAFSKQIAPVKSRLTRQSDRRIVHRGKPRLLETKTEQNHGDLENWQIINQLPTNLRPTARRLYKGYTPQEIGNDLKMSPSSVYRYTTAIQECLLDCIGA